MAEIAAHAAHFYLQIYPHQISQSRLESLVGHSTRVVRKSRHLFGRSFRRPFKPVRIRCVSWFGRSFGFVRDEHNW